MKKKIASILMLIITALTCGIFSACSGRYKDMEFNIQYAFVQEDGEIGQWNDVIDSTLSLNHGNKNDLLTFNPDDSTNVRFRVQIKNVKAKYIDDIMVYDTTSSSYQIIKQGEVFNLTLSKSMQSSIRFYETNSGKEHTLKLNVYESLKTLTHNTQYKPAVVRGESIDLNKLISSDSSQSAILFYPEATNQTKVKFSLTGALMGDYNLTTGEFEGSTIRDVSLDESTGILTIGKNFNSEYNHVLRIKASSDWYQGEQTDEISTYFDLYVVREIAVEYCPEITENGNRLNDTVKTLYANDISGGENKTQITVDVTTVGSQYMNGGVMTSDGTLSEYEVFASIDGIEVDVDSYADYNGIRIQPLSGTNGLYTFEILADENSYLRYGDNRVVFGLRLKGLTFVNGEPEHLSSVTIAKKSITTGISINDEIDVKSISLSVTNNNQASQTSLALKIGALPEDGAERYILLSVGNGLNISGRELIALSQPVTIGSADYSYRILSGATVNVNLKDTGNDKSIQFATLKKANLIDSSEYVTHSLEVKKIVTADNFEVYNSESLTQDLVNDNLLLNAQSSKNYMYLKVSHTGNLDPNTIGLTLPTTSSLKFGNGNKTLNLGADVGLGVEKLEDKSTNDYSIYRILIIASGEAEEANLVISALTSTQSIMFSAELTAKAVFVATDDEFVVKTEGQSIFTISEQDDEYKYAIINNSSLKSELHFGQMISNVFDQKTVDNVKLTVAEDDGKNAVGYLSFGSENVNKYQIWSSVGEKCTHFIATVEYYAGSVIAKQTARLDIYVETYNSVASIMMAFTANSSNQIVYINEKYTEVATTTIRYSSSSYIGTPTGSSILGGQNVNVIKYSIEGNSDPVEISFGDKPLSKAGGSLASLNGEIKVQLTKKPNSVTNYVKITLRAYSFDNALAVEKSVVIHFGNYEASDSIVLSSANIDDKNNETTLVIADDTANLYLSFLAVENNDDYAKAKFNAEVVYSADVTQKYNDLDYELYEILLDDEGNELTNTDGTIKTQAVSKNRLAININKTTSNLQEISVSAKKSQGGGKFVLKLVALDSYNGKDYKNNQLIYITISDGSLSAKYRIATTEEFENIKNDLSAYYVLTADITVTEHTTFGEFTGGLTGVENQINANGSVKSIEHTLTVTITSSETGTDNNFYGIFAKLSGNAVVADLTLIVNLKKGLEPKFTTSGYKLYIGGLAGFIGKDVTVDNIDLTFDLNSLSLAGTTTTVYIGGLAGEMLNDFDMDDSVLTVTGTVSGATSTDNFINFGGVAGSLSGKITGDLEEISKLQVDYNVGLNVVFKSQDKYTTTNNIQIGGVAGEMKSESTVEKITVMGSINLEEMIAEGYAGGVAGVATGAKVSNIAMFGFNLCANSKDVNLAGAVGQAKSSSTINQFRFISFKLDDFVDLDIPLETNTAYGRISNTNGVVAGVVADSDENVSITSSSVENFVKSTSHTMLTGETVYGIANDGMVSKCYVSCDISADTVYVIGGGSTYVNNYFIGQLLNTSSIDYNNATYVVDCANHVIKLNGSDLGVKSAFTANEKIITAGNSAYGYYSDNDPATLITDNSTVSKDTTVYEQLTFNKDEWEKLFEGLDSNWSITESRNLVNWFGFDLYFPYLKDNYTTIPTDIFTSLDEEKLNDIKSLYIKDFNKNEATDKKDDEGGTINHEITETVIVNYYYDIKNPLNNYEQNKHKLSDLVKLTVVPNDENSLNVVVYKIIKGSAYASIIGSGENTSIYFKGVTGGSEYIVVKAYALFNPDACDYFVIYTQYWFDKIAIQGEGIQEIKDNQYSLNVYKGITNMEFDLVASNDKNDGREYRSLFDVADIENYITITSTESTKIKLEKSNVFGRYTLSTTDLADNEGETIRFTVKLNLTQYFGKEIYPQVDGKDQYLDLNELELVVSINETATDLTFDTDRVEGESGEVFVVNATLTTGWVDNEATDNSSTLNDIIVNANNNIVEFNEAGHDSLIMKFDLKQGEEEYSRLVEQAGVTSIPQLFNFNIENVYNKSQKTYSYRITLSLKKEYKYRYLQDSITFNVKIWAVSNPSIDGGTTIDLVINPSKLSSNIIINNYAATKAEAMGNYTSLITSSQVETANITPGGVGGVVVVNLQPSYANIEQVTITSSELFVPSINDKVKVRFEQLVYHAGLDKYITISPNCQQTEDGMGVIINLATSTSDGVNYSYDGTIYIHVVLDKKFSGYAGEIVLTVDVTNKDGSHVTKTKSLITDYLPGVELSYDNSYKVSAQVDVFDNTTKSTSQQTVTGYLIQTKTVNNIVDLKLYGYQFNANPTISIEYLDGKEVGLNISGSFLDKYNGLVQNSDGSYSMRLAIAVGDIDKPFKVSVSMSLISNSELKGETSEIIFFPTDYVLDDENTQFSFGSTLNLAINQNHTFEFSFATHSTSTDYSDEISKLLPISDLTSAFSYDKGNGTTGKFNEASEYFECNYDDSEQKNIIKAKGKFSTTVQFRIYYGYTWDDVNKKFVLKFALGSESTLSKTLVINFAMNFYTATTRQNAFAISSADQMFDSNGNCLLGEGQNYVLTDDIVVEIAKPITTKIKSFDGNNRTITIKNFVVDGAESGSSEQYFGLFATVDESTLLYNVIVDYSQLNQIVLAYDNLTNVIFGGIAGTNNGLIYNCDVVNAGSSKKTINLLVNNNAETTVTIGGLVGVNNGTITNSRVGRSSYTRIIATDTRQSESTKVLKPLSFVVGNTTLNQGQGFVSLIGGFVGINNGTVSTSYIANTSMYTYSTNDDSKLAGFVAENYGNISYSYVKALESTITINSVYSTGARIEAFADGNIAGFVYENFSGAKIDNCFANTELVSKSAFMAGFVYKNDSGATVAQCYSACTFTLTEKDITLQISPEQPFVGADATGSLSNGVLENCYWYKDTATSNFVLVDTDKPQAQALNATNFANSNNLVNFVFVLSESKNDRDQGVWSYYNNDGSMVKLPELTIANNIAHSYRYTNEEDQDEETLTYSYTYATKYSLGGKNNPDMIGSVQEFNEVFTSYGTMQKFTGYVRIIKDLDFGSDIEAIKTRVNFTLGGANQITSVDGNGMTISNIYLDAGKDNETSVGLFAEIKQTYIKNLNLEFSEGEFSTANVMYSGGLAGKISDSVVVNISLNGSNTTIQGKNLVGGLAGIIDGQSLVYGISSNLNVIANAPNSAELFDESKYENNTNYVSNLSYAGGVAGVVSLKARDYSNETFNFSYVYVNDETVNNSLAITADYAGGVAGFVGKSVKTLRATFNIGDNSRIKGQTSAGGLFAVSVGASLEASKVSAKDDDTKQFKFDSSFADYVIALSNGTTEAELDYDNIGNTGLIESYKYGGGLIGISVGSTIFSCYSKASFYAGVNIGGLIGLDMLSACDYNYAVPFINFKGNMDNLETMGGLIGVSIDQSNNTYSQLFNSLNKTAGTQSFTFSTLLLDADAFNKFVDKNANKTIKIGYFIGSDNVSKHSNSQVYLGSVNYGDKFSTTTTIVGSIEKPMKQLYDLTVADVQNATYNTIFSVWNTQYWNLSTHTKFFPLLTDEHAENFEIISTANDFYKIKNNPYGNYTIINDIDMSSYVGGENFVFDFTFYGTIKGEKSDGSTPIIYNLHVGATKQDDAGLFQATEGARFTNVEFSWGEKGVGTQNENNVKIKTFSGFSHEDKHSILQAVNVTVGRNHDNLTSEGTTLFNGNASMTGFAGLIYNATGTSVNNSGFSGMMDTNSLSLITASADATGSTPRYIAGIIGTGETGKIEGSEALDSENTMQISGASVGLLQTTQFVFKVSDENCFNDTIYAGLLAGDLQCSTITGNSVGDISSTSASHVELKLSGIKGVQSYMSGLIAHVSDCTITSNTVVADLSYDAESYTGTGSTSTQVNIGGLIAGYQLQTNSLLNNDGKRMDERIVAYNSVNADIKVGTGSDNKTDNKTDNEAENESDNKMEGYLVNIALGVGLINSNNIVQLIQNVFIGDITTKAQSIVGGAVGSAIYSDPNSDSKFVDVELDQQFVNVNINATKTFNTSNFVIGGMIGKISGKLTLSDTMNTGKITFDSNQTSSTEIDQTSSSESTCYCIGGLIGDVTYTENKEEKSSKIIMNGTSFCLTSILLSKDQSNLGDPAGALFGKVTEDLILSKKENKQTYDIFYSTDVALVPEDTGLGTNINYSSMVANPTYLDSAISSGYWSKTKDKNDNHPYISALSSQLQQFGILTNGATNYMSGSVLNPKGSYDTNGYYYYLIEKDSTFAPDTFEGIAIGATSDTGNDHFVNVKITGELLVGSAISNIHVKYNTKNTSVSQALVGENYGTVFNCSIQGDFNTEITGGLLVNTNYGLVSHCFNNADVTVTSNCKISALVGENKAEDNKIGIIQYSYFTGYICGAENSSTWSGCGIVYNMGNKTATYSCYTAGYIEHTATNAENNTSGTTSNSGDSFTGATTIFGEYNYIDKLATPTDQSRSSDSGSTENKKAELVYTSSLMSNTGTGSEKLLQGNWATAMDGNNAYFKLSNDEDNVYGYNYNYPVYQFNMYTLSSTNELVKQSVTKHSRPTGDGSSEEHPFEIPHLGVLASVQAVIANSENGANRNYKLTRDLDGTKYEGKDASGNIVSKNIVWEAIGAVTGFAKGDFTGTFDGDSHTISNLDGQGIFNTITNTASKLTTIKNLSLAGSWAVCDSGALAVNVKANEANTNSENQNNDTTGVKISSVNVSNIIVKDKVSENNEDKVNTTGVAILFGTIGVKTQTTNNGETETKNYTGTVVVESLTTSATKTATLDPQLKGTMGLIASKMQSGILLLQDNSLSLKIEGSIDGNDCDYVVGGLVGSISGNATIIGEYSGTTTASETNENTSTNKVTIRIEYIGNVNAFGGIVGVVEKDSTGTISNIKAHLKADEFVANSFGGYANNVVGNLTLTNCELEVGTANIEFYNNTNRYFGLLTAQLSGTIKTDSFGFASSSTGKTTNNTTINISFKTNKNSGVGNDEAEEENNGFGGLVGSMTDGNLQVGNLSKFVINLNVNGPSNTGGLIGCYSGGSIGIKQISESGEKSTDASTGETATTSAGNMMITLSGSNNVGGFIGYATKTPSFVKNTSIDLLSCGTPFASLITNSTAEFNYQNWGGLIGKLTDDLSEATNNNSIKIGINKNESSIENIGGVVGYVENATVENCTNYAKIETGYEDFSNNSPYNDSNKDYYVISALYATNGQNQEGKNSITTTNVGGLVGSASGATIKGSNSAQIAGYENVGGLVGLASNTQIGEGTQSNAGIATYSAGGGAVMGAVNVGGIAGQIKGEKTTISGIQTSQSVYGNANVGGAVGLAGDGTTLEKVSVNASVKAIVLCRLYQVQDKENNLENKIDYVIPTSVGGLIGSTEQNEVTIESATVQATITSSAEGTEYDSNSTSGTTSGSTSVANSNERQSSSVISTVSNLMFKLDGDKYVVNYGTLVDFNEVATGFGGLIGTTSTKTISNIGATIIDLNINVPLGINVGGYYGACTIDQKITDETTTLSFQFSDAENGEVSGAYNIGGVFGYIDAGQQTVSLGSYEISTSTTSNKSDETATSTETAKTTTSDPIVYVQKTGTGMYVGGLVGKMVGNANNVTLSGAIQVVVDDSYYIGGLFGRLEGNLGNSTEYTTDENGKAICDVPDNLFVTLSGNVYTSDGVSQANVGGLVGMLKVAGSGNGTDRTTATVQGVHKYNFTVNTIENQNYYDGESRLNVEDSGSQVELYAQAYYINLDTFNISASLDVPTFNPLQSSECKGWHESYTGFRAIQRCIPKEQNNGADWDSISVIYDAGNIMGVGIHDGKISYTIYEEEPGVPKLYTAFGVGTPIVDDSGKAIIVKTNPATADPADIRGNFVDDAVMDKDNLTYGYKNFKVINSYDAPPDRSYVNDNKEYNQRYCCSINYKGTYYAFGYRTMYDSKYLSNSGSIFEVSGIATHSPNSGEETARTNKIWSIVGIVGGVIAVVAAIVIPGCQWYLVLLAALGGASGITNIVLTIIYANQEMQIQRSNINYLANINQNTGYLSSLDSRQITYKFEYDEKGNLVPVYVSSSGYTYYDEDLEKYYVKYSTVRPNDYYKYQYCYVEMTKVPSSSDSDSALEKIKSTSETKTTEKPDGLTWISNNNSGYGYVSSENKVCAYFLNYWYKDGYYWKCTTSGKERTTYAGSSMFSEVNNGVSTDLYCWEDNVYVYGTYENEKYSYTQQLGNKLEDSVFGKEYFGNIKTSTTKELTFYYYGTLSKGESTPSGKTIEGYQYMKGVYLAVDGIDGTGLTKYATFTKSSWEEIEGKDYTENVDYVTVNYNTYSYVVAQGYQKDVVYYILEGETYEDAEISSEDKFNDYKKENETLYVKTRSGTGNLPYVISSADSSEPKTIDKWGEKTYNSKDDLPKSVYSEIKPCSFVNPYNENVEVKNIDVYEDSVCFTTEYKKENYDNTKGITATVTYYLWQGGYVYDNNKLFMLVSDDSLDDLEVTISSSAGSTITLEKLKNDFSNYSNKYYWDGKKGVKIDDSFKIEDGDLKYKNGQFLFIENWEKVSDKDLTTQIIFVYDTVPDPKNLSVKSVTYQDLLADWDNEEENIYYKTWYIGSSPVTDAFQEKEGKLYSLTTDYEIDDDGLLQRIDYVLGDEGIVDYNYNLYCSNAKYKFYTRYKYSKDLSQQGCWDDKYSVVPSGNSIVINSNKKTYFVERVMVTLSTGSDEILMERVKKGTEDTTNVKTGSISVSKPTKSE